MGEVIQLYEPSTAVITEALADWLPTHGRVDLPVAKLAVSVDEWRVAARKVGPIIGRPIRTRVGIYGEVSAWIADWPADERERQLDLDWRRKQMEAVSERLLNPLDGDK